MFVDCSYHCIMFILNYGFSYYILINAIFIFIYLMFSFCSFF